MHGSVAYCSQVPWIMAASLRDNIIFGLPFDAQRYAAVIEACALQQVRWSYAGCGASCQLPADRLLHACDPHQRLCVPKVASGPPRAWRSQPGHHALLASAPLAGTRCRTSTSCQQAMPQSWESGASTCLAGRRRAWRWDGRRTHKVGPAAVCLFSRVLALSRCQTGNLSHSSAAAFFMQAATSVCCILEGQSSRTLPTSRCPPACSRSCHPAT
jgi:hypothetical protein